MLLSGAQSLPDSQGVHLVLYDGVCGLCSRLLELVLRHDRRRVFRFASLQSPVGKFFVERSGGNPAELTSFYVISDYRTSASRVFIKADAALFVASAVGWPWKAAQLLCFVPRSVRDRAYDIVARHRYRLFGRFDRCLIPRPDFRDRFVD